MKNKEEIINDSIKLETPPEDYSLLEVNCFLALKQLVIMFHNKQITTENATKTKKHILADYDKRCKEFEFKQRMFQKHIEDIRNTGDARIRLRKLLNENKKPITEERLCETINTCMEIISTVFKGEF